MRRGFISHPGDYTQVSKETEIEIPILAYVTKGVIGTISVLCITVSCWLVWLFSWLLDGGLFLSWCKLFGVHLYVWWPLPIILILFWWATLPAWLLIFRMGIEQVFKQWKPIDLLVLLGKERKNNDDS